MHSHRIGYAPYKYHKLSFVWNLKTNNYENSYLQKTRRCPFSCYV